MQHCLAVHFDWLKVWKASPPEILTSPSLKCQLTNDNHINYHTYVGFLIPKDVQAICTQFKQKSKDVLAFNSTYCTFVYIEEFQDCRLCSLKLRNKDTLGPIFVSFILVVFNDFLNTLA